MSKHMPSKLCMVENHYIWNSKITFSLYLYVAKKKAAKEEGAKVEGGAGTAGAGTVGAVEGDDKAAVPAEPEESDTESESDDDKDSEKVT